MLERGLRLNQIIGQEGVTQEEAETNKAKAAAIRMEYPVNALDPKERKKQAKELARRLAKVGPRSCQPKICPIIPVSRSAWWAGVASGRFPQPTRWGKRITCWRESDVLALVQTEGRQNSYAGGAEVVS